MGGSIHADDSFLRVNDDESGFFESRFNEINVAPQKMRISSSLNLKNTRMPSTLSNSVRGSRNDDYYRRTKEISALSCWSALDIRTCRAAHICDGKFNAELGS